MCRGELNTISSHDVLGLLHNGAVIVSLFVFEVSYLHSHALCSVKLMNMLFCCLWSFILLICKKKERHFNKSVIQIRNMSDFVQTDENSDVMSNSVF